MLSAELDPKEAIMPDGRLAGWIVGRVPGSRIAITRIIGAGGDTVTYEFTPDEAETIAMRMLDEVQQIRENTA